MDERLLREDDYYVAGINESGGTPYCDQLRVREATVEKAAPKLWRLNTIAAGVQLVTALTLLTPGIAQYSSRYDFAWYTNFPALDDGRFDAPDPKRVATLPIGVLSAVFLLLSALDHLAVAWPFRPAYERMLARNQNHFRWAEYSISAGIMRVMVAQLSGITDIHLLFSIFGLTATTMLFGSLFERQNGDRRNNTGRSPDWTAFAFGFVPHVISWVLVLCYFFTATTRASVPGFVWSIIGIEFLLDLSFAVALVLQWRWLRDYLHGEVLFIALSLTSKQLLAWINFGGSMR